MNTQTEPLDLRPDPCEWHAFQGAESFPDGGQPLFAELTVRNFAELLDERMMVLSWRNGYEHPGCPVVAIACFDGDAVHEVQRDFMGWTREEVVVWLQRNISRHTNDPHLRLLGFEGS